jgi:hypothetical protein
MPGRSRSGSPCAWCGSRAARQSVLQLLNMVADHRRGQVEGAGRLGEAAVLDHSDEGGDAGQAIHAAADYQATIR